MIDEKYIEFLTKAYQYFEKEYRDLFDFADIEDLKIDYEDNLERYNICLAQGSKELLEDHVNRYGEELSKTYCLKIEFSDATIEEGEDRDLDWISFSEEDVGEDDIILILEYELTFGRYNPQTNKVNTEEDHRWFYFLFSQEGEIVESSYES